MILVFACVRMLRVNARAVSCWRSSVAAHAESVSFEPLGVLAPPAFGAVRGGMESRNHNFLPALLGATTLSLVGCLGTEGVTYPTYESPRYANAPYSQPVYANSAPGYPGQPIYAPGQPGYSQPPYAPDEYMYYPSAEVYFSPNRGEYLYREGDQWVRRREPPRGFDRRSAAVRLQFRDGPERHDDEVRSTYPRNWRPHSRNRDRDRDDRDDGDR